MPVTRKYKTRKGVMKLNDKDLLYARRFGISALARRLKVGDHRIITAMKSIGFKARVRKVYPRTLAFCRKNPDNPFCLITYARPKI